MTLLHHHDRIEGDLVIEVAFTDVSLSLGDAAADDVRADALRQVAQATKMQVVGQLAHVGRHPGLAVPGRVVGRVAAAVAPGVVGHHPTPGGDEGVDDAGQHPVELGVGDEAVVQEDGWAVGAVVPRAERQADAVGGREARHEA